MKNPLTNCRHFSGYKPCLKSTACVSGCVKKELIDSHILVIHLEALGAVLRATCLLPALKRKFPRSHITWMTSPLALALLENNPLIDRLLPNTHHGVLALSGLSFDHTFCVDKSLVAAGLLEVPKATGVRKGFGVETKTGAIIPLNAEATRLWQLGLSNHEKFFVNKDPETKLMTEALGLEWRRDEYVFSFSESEKIESANLRRSLGLNTDKIVIGLNTGCSGMLPHKKLSVEGWVKLVTLLSKHHPDVDLLLLGGPEDAQRNAEIAARLLFNGVKIIQSPTDQGLRRGFALVDLCSIVVTGDSLGMHMAIALKKQVIAWFGPSCLHEIDFYQRGVGIKTESPCSPCWLRSCQKPVMCYDQVNFEKILEAVAVAKDKLLKSKKPGRANSPANLKQISVEAL